MEDEDFGFTRRADGVLKNVNNERNDAKDAARDKKDNGGTKIGDSCAEKVLSD